MNEHRVEVHIVSGKAAEKLMFIEVKQNRRNRKLKKLIKEVRQLRKQCQKQ